MGVDHTQHYRNGTPAVNKKFPDMSSLVEYGHGQKDSVRMGFYQNGCACGERKERLLNYQGDIACAPPPLDPSARPAQNAVRGADTADGRPLQATSRVRVRRGGRSV